MTPGEDLVNIHSVSMSIIIIPLKLKVERNLHAIQLASLSNPSTAG